MSEILFSTEFKTEEEEKIASKFFNVYKSRMEVPPNSLIIGRYSVLPYYKELEYDLNIKNSKLINSYKEHLYVAELMNYIEDLKEMTPKTWSSLEEVPYNIDHPLVLKGSTNSKKFLWNTHMYAEDRSSAVKVMLNLMNDSLIGQQQIRVRKYEPLVTFEIGAGGYPITKEFRFFVLDGKIISGGYYWSPFYDDLLETHKNELSIENIPKDFLNEAIRRVKDNIRFFAIDVAQKIDGNWIVIEINDGQMSGLCMNEPQILYENLKKVISGE